MEVHEIHYFLALCETLNFTRAAERCNVTQPALSRAVRRLEDKLGAPLFNRERGNTHLTEFGRLMQPYFRRMLRQKAAAEQRARAFVSLQEARLAIGLMCTIGPAALMHLFREFATRHAGIKLYLKDGEANTIEQQLITGVIDVALYCQPVQTSDEIQAVPLFSERFVVAIAPDHPLARVAEVPVRALDGHRYIWRTNCEYAERIDNAFDEVGITLDYPYNSERDDWVQFMVLAGLGFTVIPEHAVTVAGLVTRPLVEPGFERHIVLATVRGRPFLPTVRAFVEHVRRYPWEAGLQGGDDAPRCLAGTRVMTSRHSTGSGRARIDGAGNQLKEILR